MLGLGSMPGVGRGGLSGIVEVQGPGGLAQGVRRFSVAVAVAVAVPCVSAVG